MKLLLLLLLLLLFPKYRKLFLLTGLLTQEDLLALLNSVLIICLFYLFIYVASSSECVAFNDRMIVIGKSVEGGGLGPL